MLHPVQNPPGLRLGLSFNPPLSSPFLTLPYLPALFISCPPPHPRVRPPPPPRPLSLMTLPFPVMDIGGVIS